MPDVPHGMTALDLQRELADVIRDLFAEVRLKAVGTQQARAPKVFMQDLPIPKDDYEAVYSELPYIIVHLSEGSIEEWDMPDAENTIRIELYLGVYNKDEDRSGHVELLNMIQRIQNYFGIHRRVNNFILQPSFRWVLDEEDRYPNYFGAVALSFSAPRTIKEDPLQWL